MKARIDEQRDTRDGLEGEAKRAATAIDRIGPHPTPDLLRQLALATRQMLRDENGAYRRDLLKAVAQRVEVASKTHLRISGCKVELLRTLSANTGVEMAALDVPTHEPAWRPLSDETDYYEYAIVLQRIPRSDKGRPRPSTRKIS